MDAKKKMANWDFVHAEKYRGRTQDINGNGFYGEVCNGGGKKILDVGCSDLECMHRQNGNYLVGLDFSRTALKRAKQRIKIKNRLKGDDGYGTDLVLGSATHLPFKEDAFDRVACIETMKYLGNDYKKALEEISRVSNKDVILTFHHEDDVIKRGHTVKDNIFVRPFDGYEMAFLNEEQTKQAIKESGLEIGGMFTFTLRQMKTEEKGVSPDTKSIIYVECEK